MSAFIESIVLYVIGCFSFAFAQESINAQEGFDVGKQAGVAIALCFGILGSIVLTVNVIRNKCGKKFIKPT